MAALLTYICLLFGEFSNVCACLKFGGMTDFGVLFHMIRFTGNVIYAN